MLRLYNAMFRAKIVGGFLIDNNAETAELKFFDLDNVSPLFNKQRQDALEDVIAGKENVFR